MEPDVGPEGHDIVVVGASAGGVEALRSIVTHLPSDLDASVFVVLHLPSGGTSVLPKILTRWGNLEAVHATHRQRFDRACIYVAPPDQHMRFANGCIELDRGPRENGHRPAIDPMFRSAAETYGGRVAGVVLSGVLDDGAEGLSTVKQYGGATLVQSLTDAMYPTMPAAALEAVGRSDVVGTGRELAEAIVALSHSAPRGPPQEAGTPAEARYLDIDRSSGEQPRPGVPSGFTCPECNGALWETDQGSVRRFRCRTGHEFSIESGLLARIEPAGDAAGDGVPT